MNEPTVVTPALRRWRLRRLARVAAALAVPLLVLALVGWLVVRGAAVIPSNASMIGSPVRAATSAGERVFLMTSQWRTFRGPMRRSTYTRLFIDVWAFDAAGARPVWRTRLVDDRRGTNMGRRLLGVHGGVLWLLDGKELVGLSPADGARVADATSLAAANPALSGLVPADERQYRFDPQGLSFTAADGRDWRLTGQGSATRPDGPRLTTDARRAAPIPGVALPADIAGGNGSWSFYTRGVGVDGKTWLGLLAEPEVETFRRNQAIGGVDPENHPRSRLYAATMGSRAEFLGRRATYADLTPLPRSPEYVTAGLLQDGRCCHDTPILLQGPPGVLVLHRERIGGTFRLTRAALPDGAPLWTTTLPLDEIEAVAPGDANVVMQGRRAEPAGAGKRPESVDRLVTVDYATGRTSTYGFRVKATEPQDIPPSSGP
jgi:hypothetical protein